MAGATQLKPQARDIPYKTLLTEPRPIIFFRSCCLEQSCSANYRGNALDYIQSSRALLGLTLVFVPRCDSGRSTSLLLLHIAAGCGVGLHLAEQRRAQERRQFSCRPCIYWCIRALAAAVLEHGIAYMPPMRQPDDRIRIKTVETL